MKDWKRNKGWGRGEYGDQAEVSADQEEELGVGGHKDSFVSVLAVALAATKRKKKSLEARGWKDDGMKGWHDV